MELIFPGYDIIRLIVFEKNNCRQLTAKTYLKTKEKQYANYIVYLDLEGMMFSQKTISFPFSVLFLSYDKTVFICVYQ